MNLGNRIKELRENRGLSYYRLSRLSGVSGNHIKQIECGTRQPTVEKLEKILRPLGCSLNEFFNSNSSEMNLSDDELTLIINFRRISKEKAAVLLQISNIL